MDNKEKLKLYQKVLQYVQDNADCDPYEHDGNRLVCLRCIAKQALQGLEDPWGECAEDDAPFDLDEMPAGRYLALISGYHDRYGVGFELAEIGTKISENMFNPFPKGAVMHAYCQQRPLIYDTKGNSAGRLLEIEIKESGGYDIIKVIR